jgi:hypothetical protein
MPRKQFPFEEFPHLEVVLAADRAFKRLVDASNKREQLSRGQLVAWVEASLPHPLSPLISIGAEPAAAEDAVKLMEYHYQDRLARMGYVFPS